MCKFEVGQNCQMALKQANKWTNKQHYSNVLLKSIYLNCHASGPGCSKSGSRYPVHKCTPTNTFYPLDKVILSLRVGPGLYPQIRQLDPSWEEKLQTCEAQWLSFER